MKYDNMANVFKWQINAINVSESELNTIFDKLKIDTIIPLNKHKMPPEQAHLYNNHSVCVKDFPHCKVFYLVENIENVKKCGKYTCKDIKQIQRVYRVAENSNNEQDDQAANENFKDFKKRFESKYKIKFYTAFKPIREEELAWSLKLCIPSPINYGRKSPDLYHHVYKIDISSAYATELSKTIPTAEGMETYTGLVKPTSDYPFAYYPAEQKIEIYGENIKSGLDAAEKTILMKASKYSLKEVLEEIYQLKEGAVNPEERQHYKNILNHTVGYFQRKNNPELAYITAVVIARCDERVDRVQHEIEELGNDVILINTDAIAWDGVDLPQFYSSEKKLGNFMLEHADAKAYVRGAKCYQIQDGDKTLTTIYAGKKKIVSQQYKFGDIMRGKIENYVYTWNKDKIRYEQQVLNEFFRERRMS